MERKLKLMLANKEVIAIDLSSYYLKVARMSQSPTRREITDLATQNIQNLSEEEIARAIKQLLSRFQLKQPKILAVIPSFLTITKNIEIPSRDPQEIREIISLQASRHTPYSRDEIIIDYINIGTYKQNYSKILLVIATRNIIRRHLGILDKAGLPAERMVFAPEAISHILSKNLRLSSLESPASIIHIEEEFTDFIISQRDRIIFIRNIPIGNQHLLGERERYQPKFIEEVKKSLESYAGEDIEATPARFILVGAIDELRDLSDILGANLDAPVEILPYLSSLPVSQTAIKTASYDKRLSFLNAVSSLLVNEDVKLDLMPEEIKLEKSLKQRGREVIKAGILVMAAFVLIYCVLISKIYIKSSYLSRLTARYGPIHKEAKELEGSFKKNLTIRSFLTARGFPLEVLSDVYEALPLDLKISYLKYEDNGPFAVEGTAESLASVFSFVDNLGKSPYFEKVETRYTRKRKQADKDVVDFALTCTPRQAR
ncbi:pilus assembly protein PilM [Candidatus Omnitrophota bacterium]